MRLALPALAIASWLAPQPVQAACPIGTRIEVDHDIPGSGYSETSSNWTTWQTDACNVAYRYLSHTVGDGTRKGKAIWTPAITIDGTYAVRTGFRATTNRTSNADYVLYDDTGQTTTKSVNQQTGTACVWVDFGLHFCRAGGGCRLELDGTDDGESDAADITVFELSSCDGDGGGAGGTGGTGGSTGRCDSLRGVSAYEVCEETATTCAGVYTDGAGCVAFCAAAGMTCTARFGGEPGCAKEPANPIACDAANDHGSDWCECSGPPVAPDAGGGTGGTGAADAGAGTGGTGAASGTGGAAGSAGSWGSDDASAAGGSATAGSSEGGPDPSRGEATSGDEGGCGCRASTAAHDSRAALAALLFLATAALRGLRRRPACWR